MIKNLLYSLFLHFLLLLAIYANFDLKAVDESKTSEVSVSLVAINGDDTSNKTKPTSEAKAEKEPNSKEIKKEVAEAKSKKKSPKNKVKEQPKKLAKSKPAKSVAKAVAEEVREFKQPEEKPEENQKEVDKTKEDEEINENQDEEQNETLQKEKDFGSKKEDEKEEEASEKKEPTESDSVDTANNLENLDLSAREKFNIQSQLKRCYRRARDETKMQSKTKILIKVRVSEDGYIDSDLDEAIDIDRYNDPAETLYKIGVDNVRRALDLCSPLRNLPLDKYDIWKEVVLEFDGEDAK